MVSLLVLGVAGAGAAYWYIDHRIQENSVDIGTAAPAPEVKEPKVIEETVTLEEFDGAFSVLLVGNDDGNGDEKYGSRDHALNDVNILLHVSEDHQKATAISVPRDMFVDVPECTDPATGLNQPAASGVKINSTLARGGLKCVVDTFRGITGEPVDYAAMIQFEGVIAMSSAVGGVPVCVTTDIDDSYSGLKMSAGENIVEGEQALAFLRTRHGVGDGSDLARISNQQVFMSSLMKTLKSKSTLSDPKKVLDIANVVADNMTLSTSLASIPTLASLAYSLKDIPLENITFLQYPTTYVDFNGNSGVMPQQEAAAVMLQAVFNDQSVTITGGTAPGSIGAVEQEATEEPVVPEPVVPEENIVTPAPPAPSAPPTTQPETSVELSPEVTGIKASQDICSRGFGDY